MNYQERVLAFIDILGFTDAVDDTVRCSDCKNNEKCTNCKKIGKYTVFKKNEIPNKIDEIDNLFNEVLFQVKYLDYLTGEKKKIKSKVTSQCSDSIIISYLKEDAIYLILQDIYFLCVMALEKGFLFRGAVVYGKVVHTENKLFGPAFLKAYEMEQKQAIFPRIIIDDDVLAIAKEYYSKCADPDSEYNNLLKLIPCDFDGKHYINYIDKFYTGVGIGSREEQSHLSWVCENVRKLKQKFDTDARIKYKYLWLKEKYDISLNKMENR